MTWDGGEYPLNHVVLAGELLYGETDYLMSLKAPQQVRDIAAALLAITEAEFRRRYFAIDAKSYGFLSAATYFHEELGFSIVSLALTPPNRVTPSRTDRITANPKLRFREAQAKGKLIANRLRRRWSTV